MYSSLLCKCLYDDRPLSLSCQPTKVPTQHPETRHFAKSSHPFSLRYANTRIRSDLSISISNFAFPEMDRRQGSSFSERTLRNFLQCFLFFSLSLSLFLLKRDHDKRDTEKIRLARFEIRKCSYRGEGGEWWWWWWWSLLRSSKYLSTI